MRRAFPLPLVAGVLAAVVVVWPSAADAQYTFWSGDDITRVEMPDPNNPSGPPLVLKPGVTQAQVDELATKARELMPTLFSGLNLFSFDNNPLKDAGLTLWQPGRTWDGYTLLNLQRGWRAEDGKVYGAILVDMGGKLVRKWELRGLTKMLPNGSVLGAKATSADPVVWPYLVQQDWCGAVDEWVWQGAKEYAYPAERDWVTRDGVAIGNNRCAGTYDVGEYSAENPLGCNRAVKAGDLLVSGWHHDYQREGLHAGYYAPGATATKVYGGKTLILSKYVPPTSHTCPDPADLETCISRYRLQDDAIYVVDWQRNVQFAWFAHDHFGQMGFLPDATLAIREMHRSAGNEAASDYHHFNTADWVGPNRWWDEGDLRFNPEYILWDARQTNITAIIATSDHPRKEWLEGDIVWKIGPNYRAPYDEESKLGQIIGQHLVHVIPKGLPGAGNMLLFDNGGGAGWGSLIAGATPLLYPAGTEPFLLDGKPNPARAAPNNVLRNHSRVIEFNPRTLDVVWEYSQPNATADRDGDGRYLGNDRLFFSYFISGAQRLANGNTLITEGYTSRIFEVTPKGEVVWEFIASGYQPLPEGLGIPPIVGNVYRAYRVPYGWAPKRPCPAAQ